MTKIIIILTIAWKGTKIFLVQCTYISRWKSWSWSYLPLV